MDRSLIVRAAGNNAQISFVLVVIVIRNIVDLQGRGHGPVEWSGVECAVTCMCKIKMPADVSIRDSAHVKLDRPSFFQSHSHHACAQSTRLTTHAAAAGLTHTDLDRLNTQACVALATSIGIARKPSAPNLAPTSPDASKETMYSSLAWACATHHEVSHIMRYCPTHISGPNPVGM